MEKKKGWFAFSLISTLRVSCFQQFPTILHLSYVSSNSQEEHSDEESLHDKDSNFSSPFLKRSELHKDLLYSWQYSSMTGVFGPPGSGKTTLIREFRKEMQGAMFIDVDFAQKGNNPFAILKNLTGVDIHKERVDDGSLVQQAVATKQPICVVIHNAHAQYHDVKFWQLFVKRMGFWNSTVRFILIAPCSCSFDKNGIIASLMYCQLRSSLLLTEPEATAFLNQPYPEGLRNDLKNRNIVNVIVDSCAGNLTALRTSIDLLHQRFDQTQSPSFATVLQFYFSDEATLAFHTCFSQLQNLEELHSHEELLRSSCVRYCYFPEGLVHKSPAIQHLLFCGILECSCMDHIKCISPLAVRYLLLALTKSIDLGTYLIRIGVRNG